MKKSGDKLAAWLDLDAASENIMETGIALSRAIRRQQELSGLDNADFATKAGCFPNVLANAKVGNLSVGRLLLIYLKAGGKITISENQS